MSNKFKVFEDTLELCLIFGITEFLIEEKRLCGGGGEIRVPY